MQSHESLPPESRNFMSLHIRHSSKQRLTMPVWSTDRSAFMSIHIFGTLKCICHLVLKIEWQGATCSRLGACQFSCVTRTSTDTIRQPQIRLNTIFTTLFDHLFDHLLNGLCVLLWPFEINIYFRYTRFWSPISPLETSSWVLIC